MVDSWLRKHAASAAAGRIDAVRGQAGHQVADRSAHATVCMKTTTLLAHSCIAAVAAAPAVQAGSHCCAASSRTAPTLVPCELGLAAAVLI